MHLPRLHGWLRGLQDNVAFDTYKNILPRSFLSGTSPRRDPFQTVMVFGRRRGLCVCVFCTLLV